MSNSNEIANGIVKGFVRIVVWLLILGGLIYITGLLFAYPRL
jgi:hypothetical protein